MKIKIIRRFVKYLALLGLFAGAVLLPAIITEAQTKPRKKSNRRQTADAEFFVPCAKALRIGLDKVEKLHDADITRRNNGDEGDSDTELLIEKNAFENYLKCRRADTARQLQKLPADERAIINQMANAAKSLARMRVDLIYGVSFDERYDDPVNYVISQRAVILVEDYKAELTWIYQQTRDSNALGNAEDAARDEIKISNLLRRIERIAGESDEADKFPQFKIAVEKTLAEIANDIGTEKRVTTAFLVRLLEMNLPAEN